MKTFIEWMDGKNGYTFRGNMKEMTNNYIQEEIEKYINSEFNNIKTMEQNEERNIKGDVEDY